MAQTKSSDLPFVVAELVKRMSRREQMELFSYFPREDLERWKAATAEPPREPEVYVKLNADSVSFEMPEEYIVEVLTKLVDDLNVAHVRIRFDVDDREEECHVSFQDLHRKLTELEDVLEEEAVVFELGPHTLYSNGGGCMLLKMSDDREHAREIAEHFLRICGFSHRFEGTQSVALVRDGILEVR